MSTNKEMKLILESWRGFVDEAEKSQDYGQLYIFENDTVKTVSFYDRLNMLAESEQDVSLFFEQWEKSVDYQLASLDEASVADATAAVIRKLGVQVFRALQRFSSQLKKYLGPILGVVGKILAFVKKASKNPTVRKVAFVTAATAVILAAQMAGADSAEAAGIAHFDPFSGDASAFEAGKIALDQAEFSVSQGHLEKIIGFMKKIIAEDPQFASEYNFENLVPGLENIANTPGDVVTTQSDEYAKELGGWGYQARQVLDQLHGSIEDPALSQAAEAASSAIDTAIEQAPEASRSFTTGNPVAQAANALGQVLMSGDDPDKIKAAMETLKSVQDAVGAPDALKGVDLGNLDKAGARKLLQAIESAHGFKG